MLQFVEYDNYYDFAAIVRIIFVSQLFLNIESVEYYFWIVFCPRFSVESHYIKHAIVYGCSMTLYFKSFNTVKQIIAIGGLAGAMSRVHREIVAHRRNVKFLGVKLEFWKLLHYRECWLNIRKPCRTQSVSPMVGVYLLRMRVSRRRSRNVSHTCAWVSLAGHDLRLTSAEPTLVPLHHRAGHDLRLTSAELTLVPLHHRAGHNLRLTSEEPTLVPLHHRSSCVAMINI